MKTWELDGRTIYEIPPLRTYLKALDAASVMGTPDQPLALLTGECGSGKTVGAQLFADHGKPLGKGPVYLEVPAPPLLRPRTILEMIGHSIGAYMDYASPYRIGRSIAEHGRRFPRLVIVDDAQNLRHNGLLDMVLWIAGQSDLTFALVGPPSLEHHLRRCREGALMDRVVLRHHLRLPTVEEIAPLFEGFPPEAVAEVHEEAGGSMRGIIARRPTMERRMERRRIAAQETAPKPVRETAAKRLARVG